MQVRLYAAIFDPEGSPNDERTLILFPIRQFALVRVDDRENYAAAISRGHPARKNIDRRFETTPSGINVLD